jgi:hypothetical protein
LALADHTTQWKHAIGHALSEVEHVRHHAKIVGGKVGAQAAKAGDHFIKNQQNAMLVADLAQALEIAFGRHIPTRAACHGFDNNRCHIARVMQRQNAVF